VQGGDSGTRRTVVPRWRPLSRTPFHELASTGGSRVINARPLWRLEVAHTRWRAETSLENAVDLFDTAMAFSNTEITREVAEWITVKGSEATPAILSYSRRTLGTDEVTEDDRVSGPIPTASARLQYPISRLKHRMAECPRDAISACELSRLYTVAGQRDKSVHWMQRALSLAPDDRYILRSCAQLFTHRGEPERALEVIWQSTSVRQDPWIQAAEVAVADASGRSPRWAQKQRAKMIGATPHINRSELAVGLATLEEKSGSRHRSIGRLIQNGLVIPTENAVAQAIWLEGHTGVEFKAENSIATVGFAGEAKARQAVESGDYRVALSHCDEWILDEPYSVPGYMLAGVCSGTYLNDHERAIRYYLSANKLSPRDPRAINGLLVANVYAGKLTEAEDMYTRLSAFRNDQEILPYLRAAHGLIQFRVGNIEEGRLAYLDAIEASAKLAQPGLDLVAAMYWIEQEALFSGVDMTTWGLLREAIDRKTNKLPKGARGNVSRLWSIRSASVSNLVSNHVHFPPGATVVKPSAGALLGDDILARI